MKCTDENRRKFEMKNAIGLYFNTKDSSHLHVIVSDPAGVIEINVKNPYRPYLQK